MKTLRSVLLVFLVSSLSGVTRGQTVRSWSTPSGIRFSTLGDKPPSPRATIFVFAGERIGVLSKDEFMKFGTLMSQQADYLFVSLDAPAHGEDRRPGEAEGIRGWRERLEKNEDFVSPFVINARAVLDHLVKEHCTDERRVAVSGTSRGGYLALHMAAAEPRIRAVVLFSGVTRLPAVLEFKGLENHALTQALSVANLTDKLAGRAVWHCIGNHDTRVDTNDAIAFTRALVEKSLRSGRTAPVELHVMDSDNHATPADAHPMAAVWLARELNR